MSDEMDSTDIGSERRIGGWFGLGAGPFLAILSLTFIYDGLIKLGRALEMDYSPLAAISMLVAGIITFIIGILLIRLGVKVLRSPNPENPQNEHQR